MRNCRSGQFNINTGDALPVGQGIPVLFLPSEGRQQRLALGINGKFNRQRLKE